MRDEYHWREIIKRAGGIPSLAEGQRSDRALWRRHRLQTNRQAAQYIATDYAGDTDQARALETSGENAGAIAKGAREILIARHTATPSRCNAESGRNVQEPIERITRCHAKSSGEGAKASVAHRWHE